MCILILGGIIFVLAGCQASGEAEDSDYQIVVQDYAELILKQDELSGVYDEALDVVGAYLDGDVELSAAEEQVKESINVLNDYIDTYTEYELTDEVTESLDLCDINAQEYKLVNNMAILDVEEYVTYLGTLYPYLSYESEEYTQTDELSCRYKLVVAEQELNKLYTYCSINYWFAPWEDDMLVYVEDEILSQLESIDIEDYSWENDRDSVETKGEKYLLELEEVIEELAGLVGEQQEALYEMEAGSY